MTIKKPGKVTITISADSTASYEAATKRVVVYAVRRNRRCKRLGNLEKL